MAPTQQILALILLSSYIYIYIQFLFLLVFPSLLFLLSLSALLLLLPFAFFTAFISLCTAELLLSAAVTFALVPLYAFVAANYVTFTTDYKLRYSGRTSSHTHAGQMHRFISRYYWKCLYFTYATQYLSYDCVVLCCACAARAKILYSL